MFALSMAGGNAIANGEISQLRSDNGGLGTQSLVVVTAVFVAGILAGFIVDGVVIYSRLLVWSMGRYFISVWFIHVPINQGLNLILILGKPVFGKV